MWTGCWSVHLSGHALFLVTTLYPVSKICSWLFSWVKGSLFCVHMCVWRPKCQLLERTPRDTRSHLSLVLVTGESGECAYFVGVYVRPSIRLTISLGRILKRPEGLRESSWEGQLLGLDKLAERHVALCVCVCVSVHDAAGRQGDPRASYWIQRLSEASYWSNM